MNAPIKYYPDMCPSISLEQIDRAIQWDDRGAPRSEAYYAQINVPYTYGKGAGERTYNPILLNPSCMKTGTSVLEHIWWLDRDFGNDDFLSDFELLFCNRYADQHQHLGWHADDSPAIDANRPIIVISFGAEREIWFRDVCHDRGKPFDAGTFYGPTEKLTLQHGSILVMPAGMQQTYEHRIPKHDRPCGPRVSLTFRGLTPGFNDLSEI